MATPLRAVVVLLAGLMLSGCGLFGDDDQAASPDELSEAVLESVRVEFDDRWFDIDPTTVLLGSDGEPTDDTVEALSRSVENLSVRATAATDAGIEYRDGSFVVVNAVPGEQPDISALAKAVANSQETSAGAREVTVQVPFEPLPAAVSDDDAQEYADVLNERLGDGVEVAIAGQKKVLAASVVGPATTVTRDETGWDVSINFADIDEPLARLFPDVGTEGGEASFTVEAGESEDDPSRVVIVPGPAATVCCDEASVRRIEQTLTQEQSVATLLFKNIDGERGTAWAQELGITELVASFSTRYTPGQSRNINIQRIAELTQGVVIEPGESFSLNEFVGQRTVANGFVPAGTIVNGHLVDSVGGGISQYVTTLFNTSFFAGLEFERYQSHSIYFSRYPYGREATISWPAPAFEISNPTPYGILIWPIATDSGITVEMYSTKWVDVEQTGQTERAVGVACTRVTTERTRTYLDGTVDVDTVFAQYRQEGIACDGTETVNPNDTTTTSTTIDPDASTTTTTTVDPDAPTTTADPDATTTTADPNATTTTTTAVAPTTTEDPAGTTTTTTTTTTSSTTTTVAAESSTSTDP